MEAIVGRGLVSRRFVFLYAPEIALRLLAMTIQIRPVICVILRSYSDEESSAHHKKRYGKDSSHSLRMTRIGT